MACAEGGAHLTQRAGSFWWALAETSLVGENSRGMTSTQKRWLLRGAKVGLVVLILWAVRRTLVAAWSELIEGDGAVAWDFRPGWLMASGVVYLVGLLPAGIYWHRILRNLGQRVRLSEALRAYYIGHLGKYVPGKVTVVVLRVGLIWSARPDGAVAAASVFLETFTWLACGGVLAAVYLAATHRTQAVLMWGAIGLAIGLGLPTVPWVFRRVVRLAASRYLSSMGQQGLEGLGLRTLLAGWACSGLAWLMLGLSYWTVLRGMGIEAALGELPRYLASVAMATLTGFVVVFIPGGLGIREAVLAELMAPHLGGMVGRAALYAVASAAVLRVVWVVSELVISGILYWWGPPTESPP